MTTLAMQWMMESDNGNPADTVMNTWHFKTDDVGTPAEEASDCEAQLHAFYVQIGGYLSNFLAGSYTVRAFDLSDPEPRVPVWEHVGTQPIGTDNDLPCEVAVALSYQAERVSGFPQARRRGRIFIGPLKGSSALVADTGSADMIVDATFRADLTVGAAELAGVFVGPSSGAAIQWCVFSPTDRAAGRTLAQSSNNVTDGWIDYAVDIQRRRGHAPGGRTLWTA